MLTLIDACVRLGSVWQPSLALACILTHVWAFWSDL
jgi:hypothetical protein